MLVTTQLVAISALIERVDPAPHRLHLTASQHFFLITDLHQSVCDRRQTRE